MTDCLKRNLKPFVRTLCAVFAILFVTGAAIAQEKFGALISADPQFPRTIDSIENTELSKKLITAQYKSMNKLANEASVDQRIVGVIVNGDLTEYGHESELSAMRSLIADNLSIPYWPGLGNHDYINNLDDCDGFLKTNSCASRMVQFMWNTIERLDVKGADFHYYRDFFEEIYTGSMSYYFDIGRVRFIQLQYAPTYSDKFKYLTNTYHIQASLGWLESQLVTARNSGFAIVLNMHNVNATKDDPVFINLVQKYGVSAIFGGHWHDQVGKKTESIGGVPWFQSGSAMYKNFIWAGFDLSVPEMKVAIMTNNLQGTATAKDDGTYPLNMVVPQPPFPPVAPKVSIEFFNQAGYVSRSYLRYRNQAGVVIRKETSDMTAGSKTAFTVPAGSSDLNVKTVGFAVKFKDRYTIFDKTFKFPIDECFKVYGTIFGPDWNNNC